MGREVQFMGAWGIRAFESDAGLDAVDFIRKQLPKDGKADLRTILAAMRQEVCGMCDPAIGQSHSAPMALAEILVKFLDRDIGALDYDNDWAAEDNKFAALQSFTADKESLSQIEDYLSESLQALRAQADSGRKWGGWIAEEDWLAWQSHMEALIDLMDTLIAMPGSQIDFVQTQEPFPTPAMEISS